jgi:hypothetical protein
MITASTRTGMYVQAEKDRYPLFPELVRYPTTESRLEAMQEHRITWWQQHRNHVAASWREARASLRSLPPGPSAGILRLLADLLAARAPCLPPWHAARPQSKEALFLARLGRIAPTQMISQGRLPLGNVHDRDCHFMRHVANFWSANEF